MDETEKIYVHRLIPKGSELEFHWDKNVSSGKTVTKGSRIGYFNFKNSLQKFDLFTKVSGQITFLQIENYNNSDEEIKPNVLRVCEIVKCKHPLVYDETCTICFEGNIKRHTHKIFDKIGKISANDMHVSDKIKEITGGEKQILILDLDHTVIHAR